MDRDRMKGAARQAEGVLNNQDGKQTENTALAAKGRIRKAEGTVQKTTGKAKDSLRKG